jgi:hypothetical protein
MPQYRLTYTSNGLPASSVVASTSLVYGSVRWKRFSSDDFGKRWAGLYFSMMRVAKATTFSASTSSTSQITIVVLNIVDPFRNSIAFIAEYLRHEFSIPLVRSESLKDERQPECATP